MENENLVSPDNQLQNAYKQYQFDINTTTNRGIKQFDDPKALDRMGKLLKQSKPNDFNRLSQDLKEVHVNNMVLNASSERGAFKDASQRLKEKMLQFREQIEKERQDLKIGNSKPLISEEDLSLGVKRKYGDELATYGPLEYLDR